MATVNITQAAKLVGISRSYFHRKYVKAGLISVSTDSNGKKEIDTSELLRVFGKLGGSQVHSEVTPPSTQQFTPPVSTIVNNKPDHSAEVEQLRRQLQETKESEQRLRDEFLDRENWYRQQIEKQDDKIKLLEHHQAEQYSQVKWWHFWK